jgi:hypothetical protein
LIFTPSAKWSFSFTGSIEPSLGNLVDVASAYVLKSYRNIDRNQTKLLENYSTTLSGSLAYRDAPHFTFWTNGITYSKNKSNLLYQQSFVGNLETIGAEEISNSNSSASIFGNVAKYFLRHKTSIGLSYNYGSQDALQIQNGTIVKFENKFLNLGGSLSSKIQTFLTLEYSAKYRKNTTSYQLDKRGNSTRSFTENLSFNFFLGKFLIFQFKGEHLLIQNRSVKTSNYFFSDFNVWFQKQKRVSYELGIQNIFNTASYTTIYLYNNIQNVSFFKLRPRQVIARMSFSF